MRPSARRCRVHAAVLLAVVLVASCGGSGGRGDSGVTGFSFCPGFALPAGAVPCRGDADCPTEAAFCIRPGEFAGCGAPPDCTRLCESDPDCTSPTPVCLEDRTGCEQACFMPPTACVASCTISGCATGEQCDDVSGRCSPTPCELGWACPPSAICDSGFFTADAHGCVRRTCMADADCDCGTCVFGACWELPGQCMPAAA